MLERYGHGGDLRTAEETFGLPASAFLDFSSNMNPLGPPSAVRAVLVQYAEHIEHYPDPVARNLTEKLAGRHQIPSSSILIGNGAAELIDLVVRALHAADVTVAVPCFAEYGDAVRKQGGVLHEFPLQASRGFALDEQWIAEARGKDKAELYIIGSPNNPTGKAVEPALVRRLLDSGAAVVVDEAFLDFVPEETRLTLIQEAAVHPQLFVIRSMTKFYSIPGIRLGYIISHPDSIRKLRRLQVPWSVNSLAQLIGEAVLGDCAFEQATRDWLQEEKPRLVAALAELGFQVYPSDANYLLLRIPLEYQMSASQLQAAMGRRGVLIRDASRFPGLDGSYIRVAVKLREQNERLVAELKSCLEDREANKY